MMRSAVTRGAPPTAGAPERVWVSTIDPLNLAGVILPGGRIPAQSGRGVLYIDGLPQVEVPTVKQPVPSKLTPRLAGRTR